jgi:hypothetical protein
MIYFLILLPIIILLIIVFTNNSNNNTNINNKYTDYIDDDCGSSQYITYMKQFTPEQHQAEMNREVKEMWKDITYADLND